SGPRRRPAHRRWIVLLVLVAVAGCAVAISLGLLVTPLVVGTVTADPGEKSPSAGLLGVALSFGGGPDRVGGDRLIVPERRGEIGRQRRDYINAMVTDRNATGWTANLSI